MRASGSTVYRTKRRFVEGNLEAALAEAPRAGAARKLSGKEESLLIATACSAPPTGRVRWTLELYPPIKVELSVVLSPSQLRSIPVLHFVCEPSGDKLGRA